MLDELYNNLSPGGEAPEGAAPAPAPAKTEQLVLAAADISAMRELKEKGKLSAIGEYIANLI